VSESKGNNITGQPNSSFRSGIIRKTEYFDLFISYKRDANGKDLGQQLAERLYKDLTAKGFKVWLDNEEIGFSRDFEKRIEEAILHSKKFACVLSPEWLDSENCRYEYLKALEFEKRIVPLHYNSFRTELRQQKEDGILTEAEWRRLDKPQEINFSREEFYQTALKDLVEICRLKDEITLDHTKVLCESYYWKNFDQPQGMLLRGTQLTRIKRLKQRCDGDEELPSFTPMQNEFLDASDDFVKSEVSRKRKVFIDYPPKSVDLATELDLELRINNISTWFQDFDSSGNEESAFIDAILNSQTVVHITTANEEDDDLKLAFARSNNKRIIQVTNSIEIYDAHQKKGDKNIYLWQEGKSLDEIVTTINGDATHVAAHAELLEKAFVWESEGKADTKLLLLKDARTWKDWYQKAEADGSDPAPSLKMIEFVERSLVYGAALARRKRMIFVTTLIGLFLLVGMTIGFFVVYGKVQEEQNALQEARYQVQLQKAESEREKQRLDSIQKKYEQDSTLFANEVYQLNIEKAISEDSKKIAEALLDSANIQLQIASDSISKARDKLTELEQDRIKLEEERDQIKKSRDEIKDELAQVEKRKDSLDHYLKGRNYAVDAYQFARFYTDSSYAKRAAYIAQSAHIYLDSADASVQMQPLYEVGKKLVDDSLYYSEKSREKFENVNELVSRLNANKDKPAQLFPDISYLVTGEQATNLMNQLKIEPRTCAVIRRDSSSKYIAVGYKNGAVDLVDAKNLKVIDSFRNHTHRITDLAFNPSGSYLCVASVDNTFSVIPLIQNSGGFGKAEILEETSDMRITNLYFLDDDVVIGVSELGAKAWGISVSKLLELVANEY